MKLHEYTLRESLILEPSTLSAKEKNLLLALFGKLKETSFPNILEQLKTRFPSRVEVDKTIFKVLGFSDDEINQLLDYLYPALANEIEQLKTLMQG